MHSIARISTALDRIAAISRARGEKPASHATVASQEESPATPNTDIAARLDHLIEQLRVALSSTAG